MLRGQVGKPDPAPLAYDAGARVLAGEHASALPAWQEGAILSSLDAIGRVHERVIKT